MRKNLGAKAWFYPLPVLIIGSYDENGAANAMNAAWGGIYERNQVILCLDAEHKTTENIKAKGAFTLSFADTAHVVESDYVGMVSANKIADKLEKARLHTVKSEFVDAPVIVEYPLTLECKLVKVNEDGNIIGEIVNTNVDESVLDENGLVDLTKFQPISFDPAHNAYLMLGEKVGNAFQDWKKLK